MSDDDRAEAVTRALVENRQAFLGFLERRVGSRDVAEEILQSAFARGIEHATEVRDEESATAWFYRLLRNAVIDHHRGRGRADRALDAFAAEVERAEAPEVETRAAVCQCVARLAETLKPEYAEALRRVEVEGVAVKDFATEAGISSNNAGVRVFRAREALRKQVMASCGACAEHGCVDCTCAAP